MNVRFVLNAKLEVVVGVFGGARSQRSKGALGPIHIPFSNGFAQNLAAGTVFRQFRRRDRMKNLLLAAALGLHSAGISMDHLEHRQSAASFG